MICVGFASACAAGFFFNAFLAAERFLPAPLFLAVRAFLRSLQPHDVTSARTLFTEDASATGMLSRVVELKSCFQPCCWNPNSRRLAARTLRSPLEWSPRTTAMTRRLSRVAVATTLNPESQVKPVFMPSAPSNERSRPLCVTMRCLPRRISGFDHRNSYSGKSVSTARASLARSRAVVT